jgi:hypothetical protein
MAGIARLIERSIPGERRLTGRALFTVTTRAFGIAMGAREREASRTVVESGNCEGAGRMAFGASYSYKLIPMGAFMAIDAGRFQSAKNLRLLSRW